MTPGTYLGHYEFLAAIGKRGMCDVWRARDTKLGIASQFVESSFDLSPEGRPFVVMQGGFSDKESLAIIVNWFEDLKLQVPAP